MSVDFVRHLIEHQAFVSPIKTRRVFLGSITTALRNLLPANNGWIIYNSTTGQFEQYWNGWYPLAHVIQDEAVALNQRPQLNFTGAGVTATDNAAQNRTDVTIPGDLPHDILSLTHTDSLPAAVVRGDIIRGNATPDWSRLGLGTAYQVLQSDGTDLVYATHPPAEGRPSAGVPQLIIPGVDLVSFGTLGSTADALYYEPMYVVTAISISGLTIEVTNAAGAGRVARLGLYNADKNWQPTTLIVDAGTVAVDAIAIVTAATATILPPGRYLKAFVTNSTPVLRAMKGGVRYMGVPNTLGANPYIGLLYKAAVGSGALANPGIPWDSFSTQNTPFNHRVFVTVSTP